MCHCAFWCDTGHEKRHDHVPPPLVEQKHKRRVSTKWTYIARTVFLSTARARRLKGNLLHLQNLPYGIFEAGMQWPKTFEPWLLGKAEFERTFSVGQILV